MTLFVLTLIAYLVYCGKAYALVSFWEFVKLYVSLHAHTFILLPFSVSLLVTTYLDLLFYTSTVSLSYQGDSNFAVHILESGAEVLFCKYWA